MELSQKRVKKLRRIHSGKFAKAIWSKSSGARKPRSWKPSYWSNGVNSTKSENRKQRRACKRKGTNSSLRSGHDTLQWIAVYIILHLRTLSSFFTSGFCHDSSVSPFDSERAIICEILFDFIFNFSSSVKSSLLAKQTIITSGAANGQRKRTDQLQFHAELMGELPLNFFQTLFFIGNFYLAKKTNLDQKFKSSSVFQWCF